jgi:hypothetical protein
VHGGHTEPPRRWLTASSSMLLLLRLRPAVHRRGGAKDTLEIGDTLSDIGGGGGERGGERVRSVLLASKSALLTHACCWLCWLAGWLTHAVLHGRKTVQPYLNTALHAISPPAASPSPRHAPAAIPSRCCRRGVTLGGVAARRAARQGGRLGLYRVGLQDAATRPGGCSLA